MLFLSAIRESLFNILNKYFFSTQVGQLVCSPESVCLNGLAVSFSDFNITIRHNAANYITVVHVNGDVTVPDEPIVLTDEDGDTFTLIKTSSKSYEIRTKSLNMYVHVNVMERYIIADVEVPTSKCCLSPVLGLCGPCQGCGNDSPSEESVIPEPTDGRDDIRLKIQRVQVSDGTAGIFNSDGTSYPTNPYAGYCLAFRDSAVILEEVHLSQTQYTCVEFFIKTCLKGCGGTFFSYATSKIFYLSTVHGYISIHYGNINITTDLYLGIDVWNLVSLIWDSHSYALDVYIFDVEGLPVKRTFSFEADIFSSGGGLCLGAWQPGYDGTGLEPEGAFVGIIDDLRVWDR